MRVAWMAATVGGFAAAASGQSNFSFQPVFSGTVDGGDTPVDALSLVVLYDGGHIATLGQVDDFRTAVIYSQPDGNGAWTSGVVARQGDPRWNGAGNFDELRDLSLTSNGSGGVRLHIVHEDVGTYAIYQYDPAGGPVHSLFEGDTVEGLPFSHSVDNDSLTYQVNAQGQLAFGGTTDGEVIGRMHGSTLELLAGDADGIQGFATHAHRRAIAPNGSIVTAVTGHEISEQDVRTLDVVRITGAGTVGSLLPSGFIDNTIDAVRVLAANDTHAIFQVTDAPSSVSTFVVGNSGSPTLLHAHDGTSASLGDDAVLTGNGRAALYAPASGGDPDSLKYLDLSVSATPQTVAQAGMQLPGDFTILDLALDGQQPPPMINDNGVIVFDALIAPNADPGDLRFALLAWAPDSGLSIVAAMGEQITIDGIGAVTVGLPVLNTFSSAFNGGLYADGLNNQNQLAFGLAYIDSEENEQWAVVVTTIPEPGSIVLLGSLALTGMSLRRRRKW